MLTIVLPILLLPVTVINCIKLFLWLWCMSRSKYILELKQDGTDIILSKNSFTNIYFLSWTNSNLGWTWEQQPDNKNGRLFKLKDW